VTKAVVEHTQLDIALLTHRLLPPRTRKDNDMVPLDMLRGIGVDTGVRLFATRFWRQQFDVSTNTVRLHRVK
jgi:hypothetical protein